MSTFAQLLEQPSNIQSQPNIELSYRMGGVYALDNPSRDAFAVQVAAKHDFTAEMKLLYLDNGICVPDKAIAVNSDTGKFLGNGVVSSKYRPCQPDDLYSLADHLLSLDDNMSITDVFTVNNMIGLQINKGNWSPTGELADTLQNMILLLTSFDGSKPTSMRTISFRPVCSNAYGGSKKLFSVRHTRNSDIRLKELKRLLTNLTIDMNKTNAGIQSLVHKAMTDGQAREWFNNLLLKGQSKDDLSQKAKTLNENKLSDFERLLHYGKGCEAGKGTRYAAFNALTNYCTHERSTRTHSDQEESVQRWESNLFGSGADFAQTGFNQLVHM